MATLRDRLGSTCVCLLVAGAAATQNLVPNGDLEQFTLCPTAISQIQRATPWFNARTGLPNGPGATPDYFNACANFTNSIVGVLQNSQGNQAAQSGEGYAGLVAYLGGTPDFREYAEVELTQPLVAGKCYELTFYLSLGDSPTNASVAGIGAYFSSGVAVQASNTVMNVAPQLDGLGAFVTDSLGWSQVIATYEAVGGESYLTLGNYHDDANTTLVQLHPSNYLPNCYFYIDNVSLTELPVGCVPLGVETKPTNGIIVSYGTSDGSLQVYGPVQRNYHLDLFDATGRCVERRWFSGSTNTDICQLRTGIYFYVITDTSGNLVQQGRLPVTPNR